MTFALRMALRELRRGRRRFLFFLLCIAIGVAGLVGIKGFNANLQQALLREARTLMAADMKVRLGQPATPEQLAFLEELEGRGIRIATVTETVSMAVNPANRETQLVQVKAVGEGYPFYGVLETSPPGAALTGETALVGADLLDQLGLKVGDPLKVGAATFTIAGVIQKEPDRVTAGFGLGPRVMINQEGIQRAKLIQFGSRAEHSFLLKLADPQQVEQVRSELKAAFAESRGRVSDFREAQPQIRRFLDRMTAFLSLVSMVALLVGGVGVANAARVFIQQKLDTIAILKCVGATTRRVVAIYLVQMMLLSLAGSLLGVALGYGVQLAMPQVMGNFLNLRVEMTLSPEVALQGIIVGLLTALLFTLMPLGTIADVKPAVVFRRDVAAERPRPTLVRLLREGVPLLILGLGLALISAWVSGSLEWGFTFMGGLAGAVLLLGAASTAAVRLVRRLKVPRRWLTVRQGLANLHRPGSQAGAVVLALGVGVTVVLGVYLLQRGLMHEVRIASPEGTPNLFFIDLQREDAAAFTDFLRAQPGVEKVPEPVPTARARLVTIDGKSRDELNLDDDGRRWFRFEFNITYSAALPEGNEVLEGRWWTEADWSGADLPLVSVELDAAERLRLQPGSVIEMDVMGGIPLKARVFNIRRTVDIRAGNGFNFVFAPGAFDGIPVTYFAQARVAPEAIREVQKATVARFPGVTVINLSDILETVGDVLDRIGLVIRFVAGFSVAAGLIILASSIAATKFRRTREAVLYKTLGATRARVWRIFAVEYAALGLVAGLVGALLSVIAAWAVLTYVMDLAFRLELLPLLAGVGVTVLLTVTVGVLSTLDVLAARPLQVLREE